MTRKHTTLEFITSANIKHGGKYDYRDVEYINSQTGVSIICKIHGKFIQTPYAHLHSTGCPKCSGKVLKTKDTFINDANVVHGNKYSYDKIVYTNSKTKVTITCNVHGDFDMSPNTHLRGASCPKCTKKYSPTTEEFISASKQIHGNLYEYSEVKYVSTKTEVKIFCNKHKEYFYQIPYYHLRSIGCPKCKNLKHSKYPEFKKTANSKYNSKYNYDDIEYLNMTSKMKIYCNTHKVYFFQTPESHLNSPGCPDCIEIKISKKDLLKQERFLKKLNILKRRCGKKYSIHFDEIRDFDTPISCECNKHKLTFIKTPNNLMKKDGCPKCNYPRKITTEEFIRRCDLLHPNNEYDYTNTVYKNTKTDVTILCKLHGYWTTKADNILGGCGCPTCGLLNRKYAPSISAEDVIIKANKIHNNKYSYDMTGYINADSKITITCPKHKKLPFKQRVSSHFEGYGCPHCKTSKGETKIRKYLENKNLSFTSQHKFDDCIHKRRLSFDFAVYGNKTLKCVIEYNGQQHYQIIKWHGSDEKNERAFEMYKLRDKIKEEYCTINNIPLLILRYDDNNVEVTLENFLTNLKLL